MARYRQRRWSRRVMKRIVRRGKRIRRINKLTRGGFRL